MTYSIGEFSRIARVTVKALRLYHDRGLLVPDFVDPESGYRYYAPDQVSDARVIQALKAMGFSLAEIKQLLEECVEDGELVAHLNAKRRDLETKVSSFRKSIDEIDGILRVTPSGEELEGNAHEVEEKQIPAMLVAGYRMKGRYDEVGKGFKVLGRHAGRFISGRAMCLYYDGEYKEEDADIEPCFEVKRAVDKEGVASRELPGGTALTYLFKGPYERLSEGYAKLFEVVKREGAKLVSPSREVYHKGPGMILKGNPEKYLTEIQFLVE
ncbi:MerR family transcriptional regulator [Pelagicoccus sp. SDUM812003]|uniref:MerR family transcriptional regulator n=1 Tax=Pelagicoccus sp. SDUM812003 TaxID=3041267 RepID=UPI00280C90CA|nr:MerR family transcriptional regulator [Pelagicoccus sp. SDUM812003]MDQ8203809.1 MerR family transcriptional regulator [Pelagicoccus sp. SDUM812003]